MVANCEKCERIDIYLYSYIEINKRDLVHAEMRIFEIESTVSKNSYVDSDRDFVHTNPVLADSSGRFPKMFIDKPYRVVIFDSRGVWLFADYYE